MREICLNNLLNQNYTNWKALLIGSKNDVTIVHNNFLYLECEGVKEEKIQFVYEYYKTNNLNFDYIIRLDDDDAFNPRILNEIKALNFDIYVDKYHSFFNCETGQVAQSIKFWFPNTCIIKTTHAFLEFGIFPLGDYTRYKNKPLLIENEHNHFHLFFDYKHTILFSKKSNPVYLRILSRSSITSQTSNDYNKYLIQFGFWNNNKLKSFSFLNKHFPMKSIHSHKVNFYDKLKSYKEQIVSSILYKKRITEK